MEVLKVFRHEFKYSISYQEMLSLRSKLEEVLDVDRDSSGYMIRSLYFDSVDDIDYYEKLGGEINRKKIRIRIYDTDNSVIKLELKSKYDYHQEKESLIISREDAIQIINQRYDVLLKYDDDFAKKIYFIMMSNCYIPKVIIEYDRIAFMSKNNTRITFDYNIRKSNDVECFFDKNVNYYDVSSPKDVILEVKFDRFLEPYVSNILSKYISNYQSFSKYVMGRNV